jgi:hypothetical protein
VTGIHPRGFSVADLAGPTHRPYSEPVRVGRRGSAGGVSYDSSSLSHLPILNTPLGIEVTRVRVYAENPRSRDSRKDGRQYLQVPGQG